MNWIEVLIITYLCVGLLISTLAMYNLQDDNFIKNNKDLLDEESLKEYMKVKDLWVKGGGMKFVLFGFFTLLSPAYFVVGFVKTILNKLKR